VRPAQNREVWDQLPDLSILTYQETFQLSNLIIPLTELQMTTPPIKNPVSQKDLKQAIADAKTYIQKLGKILRRDVTIKVKRS
jgi:hypothetical protein